MKIKASKILLLFVLLSFIKFPFVPHFLLQGFKLSILTLTMIYIYPKSQSLLKMNKIVLIWIIAIMISSFFGYGFTINFVYGIVYGCLIWEIFILTEYWIDLYGTTNYVKWITGYLCVLCLFNDVCLFIGNNFETYVLGSKFSVAYYHILLLIYLAMLFEQPMFRNVAIVSLYSKIAFAVVTIYCIYIIKVVDTSTGLVGITAFVIIYLIPAKIKKIFANPLVAIASMLGLSGTVFAWDYILSFDVVQHFIVDVLHRSITMTGRTRIYKILYSIFIQKPILGWGYESEIVRDSLYGNAQNGVVHLLIQYGIIGVILFVVLIFSVFKIAQCKYKEEDILIAGVYSFFVMATVEIVFSNLFFVLLAMLFALGLTYQDKKSKRLFW